MSKNLEMRQSPKTGWRTSIDTLAVWAITPSCWNHICWTGIHFCCNSGINKLFNHLNVVLRVYSNSISIIVLKTAMTNDGCFSDPMFLKKKKNSLSLSHLTIWNNTWISLFLEKFLVLDRNSVQNSRTEISSNDKLMIDMFSSMIDLGQVFSTVILSFDFCLNSPLKT